MQHLCSLTNGLCFSGRERTDVERILTFKDTVLFVFVKRISSRPCWTKCSAMLPTLRVQLGAPEPVPKKVIRIDSPMASSFTRSNSVVHTHVTGSLYRMCGGCDEAQHRSPSDRVSCTKMHPVSIEHRGVAR